MNILFGFIFLCVLESRALEMVCVLVYVCVCRRDQVVDYLFRELQTLLRSSHGDQWQQQKTIILLEHRWHLLPHYLSAAEDRKDYFQKLAELYLINTHLQGKFHKLSGCYMSTDKLWLWHQRLRAQGVFYHSCRLSAERRRTCASAV